MLDLTEVAIDILHGTLMRCPNLGLKSLFSQNKSVYVLIH